MIRLLATGLVIVGQLLIAATPVTASSRQSAIEDELDGAKVLFRDGRLNEAIGALRTVIVKLNELQDAQNRTTQLAEAHLHLGLAYLAMRDESAAVENFRQVAALDPERTLDPEIYSSRVLSVFDRARSDVVRALPPDRPEPVLIAAPVAPPATAGLTADTRANALLRILPGTKIRVERTGRRFAVEGLLLAIDEKAVTVGASDWRVDLPAETLTRVQVARRRNHWLAGTLVGSGLGVLSGALETPGCGTDGVCYTRGENIGYAAIGFGLIGALVGALIKTDQWVDVPLDRAARSSPATPALAVSFSLRY